MANDAFTQQALAADPFFKKRVRSAMSTVAWQIESESNTTPNHTNRVNYARQVIRQLENELNVIMPSFVMRPNVFSFATSYDYDFSTQVGQVVSATGDPDIQAQLASDWDQMAAAAGYSAGLPT